MGSRAVRVSLSSCSIPDSAYLLGLGVLTDGTVRESGFELGRRRCGPVSSECLSPGAAEGSTVQGAQYLGGQATVTEAGPSKSGSHSSADAVVSWTADGCLGWPGLGSKSEVWWVVYTAPYCGSRVSPPRFLAWQGARRLLPDGISRGCCLQARTITNDRPPAWADRLKGEREAREDSIPPLQNAVRKSCADCNR